MIVIRACRGFEELQACVDLEIEVWGYCEGDVVPRRMFLVAQKIGGQVMGAFDNELPSAPVDGDAASMIGFAYSLPGVKTGSKSESGNPEPYLHSHMLAVKEGYRNQRIGARLKLAQRDEALSRGIRRMEWTFDPMEIKNAFLNIHKLGAIVRCYEENFYGVSSSRLQGGLQTDRLVAEWWLDTPRVISAIEGRRDGHSSHGQPFARNEKSVEISVPFAVNAWKANEQERHRAAAVQADNRERFRQAFTDGLSIVGFTRDAEGNGMYHLRPGPITNWLGIDEVETQAADSSHGTNQNRFSDQGAKTAVPA